MAWKISTVIDAHHISREIKIANEKRASHKMTTTTTIVSQTAANDSKNLASIVNAFLTQP